jgi:signal transduction histidine kinase
MKLRTQFAFLIVGIIAVPFLVSSLVLFLDYSFSRGQEPLPNYGNIFSWMRREAPRAFRTGDFEALRLRRPEGLDVIMLAADDSIAYSTIPELPEGTPLAGGAVMDFIRKNVQSFHFQVDAPRPEDGDAPLLILKVPKAPPDPEFRVRIVQVMAYSLVAVLAFSSITSFLILRSMNRSIVALEGATRRVSEGDLDYALPMRGSNEITSLARSFENMRKALKEEYARRARFIMGVSHDLRTPLALIQGYVEAIVDGYASDPETQKKYLSIIQDKTENLEGMIGDLIEFVKMETGEWRMTFSPVPVRAFLSDIAKRYAEDALILRREFSASLDVPEELAVPMDEPLVSRALENLIGNSLRYTAEGGRVILAARVDGGCVEISLSDTGIGIPREELPLIFDPFYRGTNSRREQGFGLGLTTVKSIIEGHGWSIGVVSELDKGTTFTIRISNAGAPTARPPGGEAAA